MLPGIYTGSIQETTKFGKVLTYSREAGPISFWFTVGFHATVASLIAYLEYLFLVRARWIESNKSIDVAAEKIVAWINELSKKPLSLWVVGIVFGGFFYFLFTLFAKAGGH